MTKHKWIAITSLIVASIAHAGDPAIDDKQNSAETSETAQSENQKQDQPETSTFDRIIEAIANAARNNPDYGKDIGDR